MARSFENAEFPGGPGSPLACIGVVRSVHPARREIRVRVDAGRQGRLEGLTWVGLALRDGACLGCKVESVRRGRDGARIVLGSGVPRDNVARMKGAEVVIAPDRAGMPPDGLSREKAALALVSGAVELEAIVGFEVVDTAGQPVGRVVGGYVTPAHGVIEFETPDGTVMALPVIEQVIAEVDFERACVTVDDMTPFAVEIGLGGPG